MEIKEMKYTDIRIEDILARGQYLGIKYYVKTYGTHPCGYLEVDKDIYNDKDFIESIKVHGGITYKNNSLRISESNIIYGNFIGWDYAHAGDYMGFLISCEFCDKKYSTLEIIEDCKYVISQIVRYKIKRGEIHATKRNTIRQPK